MINNNELKEIINDSWILWTEDNYNENETPLAEITEEDINLVKKEGISYYLY